MAGDAVDLAVFAQHAELAACAVHGGHQQHGGGIGIHKTGRRRDVPRISGGEGRRGRAQHRGRNAGIHQSAHVLRFDDAGGCHALHGGGGGRGGVVIGGGDFAKLDAESIIGHTLRRRHGLHQRNMIFRGFCRASQQIMCGGRKAHLLKNLEKGIDSDGCAERGVRCCPVCVRQPGQLNRHVGIGIKGIGRIDQMPGGVFFKGTHGFIMMQRRAEVLLNKRLDFRHGPIIASLLPDAVHLRGFSLQVFNLIKIRIWIQAFGAPVSFKMAFRCQAGTGKRVLQGLQRVLMTAGVTLSHGAELGQLGGKVVRSGKPEGHAEPPEACEKVIRRDGRKSAATQQETVIVIMITVILLL